MDAATVERLKNGMRYEAERTAPPEGFPRLPVIPGGRYTDPAFLELEREHMWRRAWLYACHADEIPEPGSFYLFRRTGSTWPLVKDCRGKVEGLVCSYHGWTYSLDGRLVNLRDKRDFVDLDLGDYPLVPVRCENLGNWFFVNEDPQAEPLLEHLGPMPGYLEQIQPDQVRFVDRRSYPVKCNVKVLLDAFLEVYHLKSIHQNTVDRFLDHRGTRIALWPKGHPLMITPHRRPDWQDPGTRGMRRIETATEITASNNPSFMFYPNLVTPVDATGNPFLLFWPVGPREMEIEVCWFAPDWGGGERHPLWDTRIANFERILEEDTQFAGQIQESVESSAFRGITLNYQERRIYHWHQELDRRIDPERIPQHLGVPQVRGAPSIGD